MPVTSTSSWGRPKVPLRSGFASLSTARLLAQTTEAIVDGQGQGSADDQRLYQLIRLRGSIEDRTFEIEFLDVGAEAYCFTFG